MNYSVIFLLCLLNGGLSQITLNGTCDGNVRPMDSFVTPEFAGNWYAVESLGDGAFVGDCPTLILRKRSRKILTSTSVFYEDGQMKRVSNYAFTRKINNGNLNRVYPAVEFCFQSRNTLSNQPYLVFWVLDTDYTSYGFLYHCKQTTPETKTVYAWKFSTQKTLPEEAKNKIDAIAGAHPELQNGPWKVYDHSNCNITTILD